MSLSKVHVASRRDLNDAIHDGLKELLPSVAENLEPPKRPPKEILSNREASKLLDVSRGTLQRWRTQGVLPYSKVEGTIYYEREHLLQTVREHRV